MAIDIGNETIITLSQAAAMLPPRRGGRKVHIATLFRWAQMGLGGVRLEVIRIGSALHTSREALQRFCDALTAARPIPPAPESPASRRAAHAAAERDAQALGI
ncbi:MAG: DUF1580 domain-containing protein [Phycisphaerales bacterium]|nr:DUF1580 domain-containing protein [Phycisphaerales bacterium]